MDINTPGYALRALEAILRDPSMRDEGAAREVARCLAVLGTPFPDAAATLPRLLAESQPLIMGDNVFFPVESRDEDYMRLRACAGGPAVEAAAWDAGGLAGCYYFGGNGLGICTLEQSEVDYAQEDESPVVFEWWLCGLEVDDLTFVGSPDPLGEAPMTTNRGVTVRRDDIEPWDGGITVTYKVEFECAGDDSTTHSFDLEVEVEDADRADYDEYVLAGAIVDELTDQHDVVAYYDLGAGGGLITEGGLDTIRYPEITYYVQECAPHDVQVAAYAYTQYGIPFIERHDGTVWMADADLFQAYALWMHEGQYPASLRPLGRPNVDSFQSEARWLTWLACNLHDECERQRALYQAPSALPRILERDRR